MFPNFDDLILSVLHTTLMVQFEVQNHYFVGNKDDKEHFEQFKNQNAHTH